MQKIKYYVPAIVWALFILIVCLVSPRHIPKVEWQFISPDKAVHFGLFFIQTLLIVFAFYKRKQLRFKIMLITTISVILYGMLMELLQMVMRLGRSADWDDVLANALGAVFALLLYFVFYRSLLQQR